MGKSISLINTTPDGFADARYANIDAGYPNRSRWPLNQQIADVRHTHHPLLKKLITEIDPEQDVAVCL